MPHHHLYDEKFTYLCSRLTQSLTPGINCFVQEPIWDSFSYLLCHLFSVPCLFSVMAIVLSEYSSYLMQVGQPGHQLHLWELCDKCCRSIATIFCKDSPGYIYFVVPLSRTPNCHIVMHHRIYRHCILLNQTSLALSVLVPLLSSPP